MTLPIPVAGDPSVHLALVATPIATATPWLPRVRYGAFGLAALCLLVYGAGLWRSARS